MFCWELLITSRLKKHSFVLVIMPESVQLCQTTWEEKTGEKVSCSSQLVKGGLKPDGPNLSPLAKFQIKYSFAEV